jgi:hypothetical protein
MDENKITHYYQHILNDRPNYIKTKNSYDRLCVYMAIEMILNEGIIKISCNRKKIWFSPIATSPICQKHNKPLIGACDCCSDPYCTGPYCEDCGYIDYCRYDVDIGDNMYKRKIVDGLNIYYDLPNIKMKKLKYLN